MYAISRHTLLAKNYEEQTDDDSVPELSETPVSRAGDIWICGQQRVLCGDATPEASDKALPGTEQEEKKRYPAAVTQRPR